MTTDTSILNKRCNRLFQSVKNVIHNYRRKRKNKHLKVAASSALNVKGKEDAMSITTNKANANGNTSVMVISNNKNSNHNQQTLASILPIKSPTKILYDSRVSTSCSASTVSNVEILLHTNNAHELDLMVSQHYILRTAFNADYSAPVAFLNNQQKANNNKTIVLDIGCGSGTWTMEMATRFPHVHFIGIDKEPYFPKDIKPNNCHFKLFKISQTIVKLPFMDQSVDYIFQRDINWHLSETTWLPLVREFFRILKPGGWIELVEPDIETHSVSSYEDLLVNKLIEGFYHRQKDPFISKKLPSLMAISGFSKIQSDFKSIPLGWGYQKLYYDSNSNNSTAISAKNYYQQHLRCSEFARVAASHRLDLLRSLQSWFTRENHISKAKFEAYINQLPSKWYHAKAYINWHRSTAQKHYDNDNDKDVARSILGVAVA